MVALISSKRFENRYRKLSAAQKRDVNEALAKFIVNPRHPSLHFEKLLKPYRSIRVNRGVRIILRDGDDASSFVLADVGDHDLADRYG